MPVFHLTGPGDPRAAAFRDIPDPQLLRAHGLFIAEGRLIVERLLTLARFRIRSLLLNDAAYSALQDKLSEKLPAARPEPDTTDTADTAEIDILIAATADIAAIGGFDFHRGCLALVERPAPRTLEDLRLTGDEPDEREAAQSQMQSQPQMQPRTLTLTDARPEVVVVLEGIGNADNVGGIFRNAAALGARAVVIGPRCCDPLYRKATRTSMGATLIVPYATSPSADANVRRHADVACATVAGHLGAGHADTARSWPETLACLRALGYRLVALTTHPPAVDIETFAATLTAHADPAAAGQHRGAGPRPRIALLVGAEGAGLSDEALAAATDRVAIPMTGLVDSLNVATAAGIALHRLTTLG